MQGPGWQGPAEPPQHERQPQPQPPGAPRAPGEFGAAGAFAAPGAVGRPEDPARTTGLAAPAFPEYPQPPAGWQPIQPAPRPASWRPVRRDWWAALAIMLALLVVGVVVGALWSAVAPRMEFRVVEGGSAVALRPESEEFIAADGWFALITLAAGVLAAVAVWLVRSVRGPLTLVALTLGGLLGAIITWRVGALLAPGPSDAALNEVDRIVSVALQLRAKAALVIEPIAAAVVYLLFVGFAERNDLGRPTDRTGSGGLS